jgi:outer membrane protein
MKPTHILLALAATLASISRAQPTTYTLEEAVETALANNRDVVGAKLEIQKAEAAVDEAFGYVWPSIDLSANLSHFLKKPKMAFPNFEAMLNNAVYQTLFQEGVLPPDPTKFREMGTTLQSFAQADNYEAKVQATQILFNSTVFRGIGASEIYLRLSRVQLQSVAAKTVLNVEKAFYGALLLEETLEIVEERLANAEENLENVRAMHEQGLVSEFQMLQAEVRVENVRPKVFEVRNQLESALDMLKLSMGVDQGDSISVVGEFAYEPEPTPDVDSLVAEAMNRNPDLETLDVKSQIDEAFIDVDRSEFWPSLSAFADYTFAGSGEDFEFSHYQSSMVGVALQMNLFNGFRTLRKVEQSTVELKKTKETAAQAKQYVAAQVRAKVNELERTRTLVAAQNRNVELAERAYALAVERFKEGTGTQLEVKNADVELSEAKTNRLSSLHAHTTAKLELRQLVGEWNAAYDPYLEVENN